MEMLALSTLTLEEKPLSFTDTVKLFTSRDSVLEKELHD